MNRTQPKGLFFAAEQAIAHMTDADMFEARRNAGAYVRIFAYDPYKMAAIAYTIGVVTGKKQERQRAKHRKELPEACVWNFIDTRRGRNMYNECRKCGDIQTCRWHYATLHAFFQHALEADVISSNPMDRVKRPKQSKDAQTEKETDKALNEAQVQEILKRAAEEPLKIYCMIVVALDSGMRRGELAGLKWSDIDFETGLVKITRNVQYTAELGTYITTPKSGKGREIYLSRATLSVLTRWKREQAALFLQNGWKIDFTFTRDIGPEPINPNVFTDRVKRFGKRIGYPKLHPHTFRHTSISMALLNGMDVTSVSQRAGHSSVGITMDVYSHSTEDAQKRIAATLGDVIGKL